MEQSKKSPNFKAAIRFKETVRSEQSCLKGDMAR